LRSGVRDFGREEGIGKRCIDNDAEKVGLWRWWKNEKMSFLGRSAGGGKDAAESCASGRSDERVKERGPFLDLNDNIGKKNP